MKIFSSKSTLQSKLILIIMLCCTITLFLNNIFIFRNEIIDFKHHKVVRLLILADILANHSTAALKFTDKETAKEILQSSVADESINHVVLFDDKCQSFVEYIKSANNNIPLATASICSGERHSYYSDDFLYISVPVMLTKEHIGTLYIRSGLNDLSTMLNRQLETFSILFVGTLLITFLITFKLQTLFLRPIKNLLSAIRHITQHKDYSIQVKSHTNDELALLAEEFNVMIAKINYHDKLHINQNLLLEQTVDIRTQELQANLKQLKLAKETAEIASQAKSDFLSHMSHDLRTPLNSLLGYVQILQRKADFPAKYRNEIKIIGQSSEYLLSLINDLLDLTKIESNKLELNIDTFNSDEFLTPIVELFSKQAQKQKIIFRYKVKGELPLSFLGDQNRLRRILSNLLDNAFKFTKQGHVAFIVSYKEPEITFRIEDTGRGINEKHLQAIFEPFNQFSRQTDNDGVGLGLYITRYLVDLMQGALSITSQLNRGTTCSFTLPLPERQNPFSALDKYDAVVGYQGRLKTVLIVDDKDYNLDVLHAMLEPLGFSIVCVTSGIACLEQVQKIPIDVILLDMVMPSLGGLETCKRIKQLDLQQQPKIIMVTANAFAEDREQSIVAGCHGFLAKPVVLNQLLEIFEKQLKLQWIYQNKSETQALQKTFNLKTLRILVVEDNEISRLLIEQNLKDFGLCATFAEDGKQAIQILQSTKFDCIILDYKLPYKTGIEIANYLNSHVTPNIQSYLVLMTALARDEINTDAMNAGFDKVLTKPIEIECFAEFLKVAYEKSIS